MRLYVRLRGPHGGFVALRVPSWFPGEWHYFKLQDRRRHRALFSERKGINYRRLLRIGPWELGVRP